MMSEKNVLRKDYLRQRTSLSQSVIETKSGQISQNFIRLFQELQTEGAIQNVHLFLPIKKYHEIDTWYIVDWLRENHIQVIASVSNFENFKMDHFVLAEDTILEENRWGVPEPQKAEPFETKNIHLIVVPLVIFDHLGYRIGYGKGFYDRFLGECSSKVIKVGLSIFPPVDTVFPDDHDVPLHYCVTPDQTFSFEKKGQ